MALDSSRDATDCFHSKNDREHHKPFLETAEEGEWSSPGGVEHKLEFTEIYHLFLRHFEDKISGYKATCLCDYSEFV